MKSADAANAQHVVQLLRFEAAVLAGEQSGTAN